MKKEKYKEKTQIIFTFFVIFNAADKIGLGWLKLKQKEKRNKQGGHFDVLCRHAGYQQKQLKNRKVKHYQK